MKAEQFIKDYTRNCSNELCYEEGLGNLYESWLTPDQALRAVEIAREELIEEACRFLFENCHGERLTVRMIDNFRRYLIGE